MSVFLAYFSSSSPLPGFHPGEKRDGRLTRKRKGTGAGGEEP